MSDISNIQGLTDSGSSILSSQGGAYGENPFLDLLVTELRTQTPLDPVDNNSFMQQLSSLSSMEEQRQLNDNLLQLLDFQGLLARLQGLSEGSTLLGKEVTFNQGGVDRSGVVDSVFVNEAGELRLVVGEEEIDMRSVTAIKQPATPEA